MSPSLTRERACEAWGSRGFSLLTDLAEQEGVPWNHPPLTWSTLVS